MRCSHFSVTHAARVSGKIRTGLSFAGTSKGAGYFVFLQWKLRVVKYILSHDVDVVLADVDVLVTNPHFLSALGRTHLAKDVGATGHALDLSISSDARVETELPHCPGSVSSRHFCRFRNAVFEWWVLNA